ncbi:hypothetical protein N1F78_03500 [Seonamhaeicola sp. MEBiC1930]|uniref:hypothetical protein n=1 Tax=Seonamhaeicola sp. MEBiC01930 TaxID=2976768 RepID=UPI00324472E5
MKKLKYILLSIVTIGLFSCSEDDSYSIAYVDDEEKIELVGSLSITNANAFGNSEVEINYTLPQGFNRPTILEVTLVSTFGNVFEFNPNLQKVYIDVPIQATSGSGTFTMPSFDNEAPYNGLSGFLSASITGIALEQPEMGFIEDPYVMTSDPVMVNLFEFHDPYMNSVDQTLMVSLDWEGPYNLNDLDLYIFDNPFTAVFESSESGSRFEGDFFNNPANESHPDGDYIIETAIWTSADDVTPIPIRIVLTHPDGTQEIYEAAVDPAVGFIDSVGFTKTTDGDGNAMYETYSLL